MSRSFVGVLAAILVLAGGPRFEVATASAAGCEGFLPSGCTRMGPGDKLPTEIKDKCFVFDEKSAGDGKTTGIFSSETINVLSGGGIYFVDPGKDTGTGDARIVELRVSSLLIEKGGVVQAGSPSCPIGKDGGKVKIGLYGDDPTDQGQRTTNPKKAGIQCLTNKGATDAKLRCFPEFEADGKTKRDYSKPHYCTAGNSDDPCSSATTSSKEPKNQLLEGYGTLNFDDNPWGYKSIGVSYGGTLALYGWKGAKPLQDKDWAALYEADDHCPVPSVDKSTLNVAEMQEWANFSGSSWARLAGSVDDTARKVTTITLDRVVAKSEAEKDWQVGDEIVIGATDWYPSHTEQRKINKVTASALGTQIEVDLLYFKHFDQIFNAASLGTFTNPVNRQAVDTRAVVGLLSRSIQVYSRGKTAGEEFPETLKCMSDKNANPDCYFGGHVIARQGFKQVALQGVEFKQLGQGGRMGHYPVHFHLAKSTAYATGTFVKDSSVWDSMTRFVTVHGTQDLTLSRNVGYLSLGHGFYIEDGSEIRNRLCYNAGLSARAALNEYVAEQAKMEHWCNGAPPPAARVVPPILDKTVDDHSNIFRIGSDTYMPTMYWMMNAYNEFVGNAAVGVHGFGACYWLLGSAVSGPSRTHQFDGLAGYNTPSYQAPLLRFRGNTCMTAPLALSASKEINPAVDPQASQTGYTAVSNPYVSAPNYATQVDYPIIQGNFRPIQPNPFTTNCNENNTDVKQLGYNTKSCVVSVIDRFSTSFNWAEVNFGSVWLRPWFYLFSNAAVTDQLSGGLGFVTGGSWIQALPAYLSLTQNGLFVGSTQNNFSAYSDKSGPLFKPTGDIKNYAPCKGALTCNIESEGAGYWKNNFQPKRMISIYDGPFYADGNAFMNIGSWECDPQPCANAQGDPGKCKGLVKDGLRKGSFPCGVYGSTVQPESPNNKNNIIVADAAIGWKQPNGFYYPPAFTFRRSAFTLNRSDELNKCFTLAPGDFVKLTEQDGSCRHDAVDRTRTYIKGNMFNLDVGEPQRFEPSANNLEASTIDFATILIDLDSSLTGSGGVVEGQPGQGLTSSVSRNKFFDAPAQSPECLSFGVQTSPYTFVTSIIGKLRNSAKSATNQIDTTNPDAPGPDQWPAKAAVPIYRQWRLAEDKAAEDKEPCGSVCNGNKYGCARATFLGMSSVYQASYLTMTIPPGISSAQQPGALYYIDTNAAAQSTSCVQALGDLKPAKFVEQKSYVLYNIFPQVDSRTTYQLYVGDGAKKLTDIEFRYVRVKTHDVRTVPKEVAAQVVERPCDPDDLNAPDKWCVGFPKPILKDGILTVTLDHRKLAGSFSIAAHKSVSSDASADFERCMPRDMCYYDDSSQTCQRCTKGNAKCIRQGDFLQADIDSMNRADGNGKKPLDSLCTDWASLASGNTKVSTKGVALTSADCPAGGCLGVAFTLPKGFTPQPYQVVNERMKLSRCFIASPWLGNSLMQNTNDKQCGAPRKWVTDDFCVDPQLELSADEDAFISQAEPQQNTGDESQLVVGGAEPSPDAATEDGESGGSATRSLVEFDQNAIDSFLAGHDLARATLELTLEELPQGDVLVDAAPLLKDFAEGDPDSETATAAAASAAVAAQVGGLSRPSAVTPIGGRGPRLPFLPGGDDNNPPPGGQDVPGVTWNCASDLDTSNTVDDCAVGWSTPGGDYGAATAPPVMVAGAAGTVVSWDVTADILTGVNKWLLRLRDESGAGGAVFYSAEGALRIGDPSVGPVLVLE